MSPGDFQKLMGASLSREGIQVWYNIHEDTEFPTDTNQIVENALSRNVEK